MLTTTTRISLAALIVCFTADASAQQVTIKLATLAPAGSSWHRRLQELGERWQEASNGGVRLKIYPGGTQGSEGDMLRKIMVGQLDAASVSNVGLHDVAPDPQAVTVPFLLEEGEEMDHVFSRIRPKLEAALERRGFVPIQWAHVGQVRFFCKHPYLTPSEMRRAKLFAWDGDPASVEAWRAVGFQPVVLSSIDIMPSLQTGMIDCLANVPVYVVSARIFDLARYMIDVPWGQVVGTTVVAKKSWERIPIELRPRLLEIAQSLSRTVDADARNADRHAVAAMQGQGLTVVSVDRGPWRQAAESGWQVVRGKVVPSDLFDEVLRRRDEYRAEKAAARVAAP